MSIKFQPDAKLTLRSQLCRQARRVLQVRRVRQVCRLRRTWPRSRTLPEATLQHLPESEDFAQSWQLRKNRGKTTSILKKHSTEILFESRQRLNFILKNAYNYPHYDLKQFHYKISEYVLICVI
jgi:hypothetical protein